MGRKPGEYAPKELRNIALLAGAIAVIAVVLALAGFQWSPLPLIGCGVLVVVARAIDKHVDLAASISKPKTARDEFARAASTRTVH